MFDLPEPESGSIKGDLPPGCSINLASDNPIVNLSGEIDLSNAPKIYAWFCEAAAADQKSLIINLENVIFMDSSGLQVLLRLREKLDGQGRSVLLVNPQPQVRRLFQLTGFDKLFQIFEDNDEAAAHLELENNQG